MLSKASDTTLWLGDHFNKTVKLQEKVKPLSKTAWHSEVNTPPLFLSFFTTKRERREKGHIPVPESTAAGNVNIWRGEKKKQQQIKWCGEMVKVFCLFRYFF